MGVYLNPGNKGFETIVNGVYVDKTGLIEYINGTLDTPRKLTCFSRPRRFGKSFAAKMLCAYYDRSCDSRKLFEGLEISKKESFAANLNRYDVIYLDITWFIPRAKSRGTNVLSDIQTVVIRELREAFPECVSEQEVYLPDAMLSVSHKLKRKFFVIIDEWDALFRESKDDKELQREYVQLLRGLFKGGTVTDEMIVGAYMTGILPIKKYGTQSALTDFKEFTMARPAKLAEYVGFTEPEARALCAEYDMDFENMRTWYDGYSFSRIQHVYSPNSVMNALQDEEFQNYWTESETYESLTDYITQDFGGLKEAIVQMLGGQRIAVDISTFQNDFVSFKSKDDVITLLIHLGYMAYDDANKEVYIPNLEVADAFRAAVKGSDWTEVNRSLMLLDQLLKATVNGEAAVVANNG
ncbi:MAG: AAA family ATPase [Lachnospiraceae bacterium]|nr:AAA family ATPase [Lachnospiraceae bacterium]